MHIAGAILTLLLPLALAPGLFFYYDVTPKVSLLLVAAALLCGLAILQNEPICQFRLSRYGRWYTLFVIGLALAAATSAFFSPDPTLAWLGSNWRRSGAITEIAILAAAFFTAASPQRVWTLRALCAAGIASSLYGLAQYFGWDPFLPASAYHVGDGAFQIVRPPSTMGHSDYFAAFLLWPIFAGLALRRWLGTASAVLGTGALILTGSRGALLGLVIGALLLIVLCRPRMRTIVTGLIATSVVFAVFYVSPAGERLRARVFWISEDRAGGARLLLWRDSLKMGLSRPLTGFGPDAFVAEFPAYQSRELARAYPDFYHESPHNLFLDSFTAEGFPGVLLLLGLTGVALLSGWNRRQGDPWMLAGFVAALIAQQFVVFTAPNGFLFYLGAGLLVHQQNEPSGEPSRSKLLALVSAGLGCLFLWAAHQLGSGDRALLELSRIIDARQGVQVMQAYHNVQDHQGTGVTAGIDISRRSTEAAAKLADPLQSLAFLQVALLAARDAATVAEQKQNAWYNLAALQSAAGDPVGVEASLKMAIRTAPFWYKPHWTLARLMESQGKLDEARREAGLALDLDNGKHEEVTRTLEKIRSPGWTF